MPSDPIESDSEFAQRLLGSVDSEVDADAAYRRLRRRAATTVPPKPRWTDRWQARLELASPRALRPIAVLAVLALGTSALFVTGTAESMIKIFEPQQVVAVPINLDGLGSLPDLSAYGTLQAVKQPGVHRVANLGAAATETGLHPLVPGQLPADVKGQASYLAMTPGAASFTFSKTKAAKSLNGASLPALPSQIDGSSLLLEFGPAVVETVGGVTSGKSEAARVQLSSATGKPGLLDGQNGRSLVDGIPQLVILQMKTPVLSSTGVSVRQLEDVLLSMPGVSPSLAASIRAIGDPSTTLPIPIPANLAIARQVQVQGVQGVLVGDSTGIGSAVVWAKGGMVYAVAGTISDNEVMSIATSLH